jgi:hypothetical protein
MARNINDINNLLRFIVRKERGVYVTYAEADAALDSGQLDSFNDFFMLYAVNQIVHDALSPFKVYQPFTSASDGSVTFQNDYLHLLAGVFTVYGSTVCPVRFVQTDEFPDAITSALRPVSLSKPIALDIANGFQLYPQSQQIGAYNYLRRPVAPVFGYTQAGRTITYNPATSTQLEWADNFVNNIIAKALKYFGINMGEEAIYQFAQNQDKETQ